MRPQHRLISAGMLLLAAVGVAPSRAAEPDGGFVQSLVDAINSKSPDRRRALVAPASRVCTTGESEQFFLWIASRQSRHAIPPSYTWKIAPLPAGQPLLFAEQFDYPVRPSHVLQLDFATGPTSSTTMLVQIVRDAGQWREVVACPKPETIAAGRAAEVERARHGEKVRALAAAANPDLAAAVQKLVKEGRSIEAFKHYAAVTGEDLATSKDVVELLSR
jgi:hypothetical protein